MVPGKLNRAPLLSVEGVSVTYQVKDHTARKVLDNVQLSIHAGEFVSLAGQTGCGKSTLLRLVLGSERPHSGRVLLDGVEIRHPDRHRGYVPQRYALFPDRTVLENVAFGPVIEEFQLLGRVLPRYWRRRREVREEALGLLRSMGLEASDATKYPDQLSGGMQQRVAIAQALIMRPKILLMDEAFSALDPGTRTEMQKLIRRVWAETGTTILFVTHNLAEAVFLGTRVVVLARPDELSGSKVALDVGIPAACRQENGYPRRDALDALIEQIERTSAGYSGEAGTVADLDAASIAT
jgi:NitT/TauT family transport system ATP-binding protein